MAGFRRCVKNTIRPYRVFTSIQFDGHSQIAHNPLILMWLVGWPMGVLDDLVEAVDLEAKKAAGRDGMGEVPRSVFETYSAMANTNGGIILLGVIEDAAGKLSVSGIGNPRKVVKEFWDSLNNAQVVNRCIITDANVSIEEEAGREFIKVVVPRATRKQRPVFIGANPFGGTFKRNHEGDYKCDDDAVRLMLAEQTIDARDATILPNFGLRDVSNETLKSYRNKFSASRPDHVWNSLDDIEFLERIGAWGRDRERGADGLTVAGLLMFGFFQSIQEIFPYYMLDYQERPEPRADSRWIDRVTLDGMWAGNLYEFYSRVIQKIQRDIPVPFTLRGDQRVENTPVHDALREALVNALIHADYSERVSVLIVKRPDLFGFRNPGLMRITITDALHGGTSDCRNRKLQQMFRYVGLGEQAGSGIPAIYKNWAEQHWRAPELWEKQGPDQTLMAMRMVSLIPAETIEFLQELFGGAFNALSPTQRLALSTAHIEGQVSHARLKMMSADHPHDITLALASLVRDGYLVSSGATRGTIYTLPGFSNEDCSDHLSVDFSTYPALNPSDIFGKVKDGLHRQESDKGKVALSEPITPDQQREIGRIVAGVIEKKRVDKDLMKLTLTRLCGVRPMTIADLSNITNRAPDSLRNHYIIPMVKEGVLQLRFPSAPNHPQQSYFTTKGG